MSPRDPAAAPGLRQLSPYLRDHRAALVGVAALALVGSGAALLQPLLVRRVLDIVQAGGGLLGPVLLLLVVVIGAALLNGLERYLLQRTAEGVVLSTRSRLAGHLLRLPISEHDRRRTGDLLSRVGADSTLLRAVVTSGLVEAVSSVVIVIGAAIAMLLIDPLLLAVTLASVVVGLGLVLTVTRRVRALSAEAQARVGDMTASVERALIAVRTIRASGAEARETSGVLGSVRAAYDAGLLIARLQSLVAPFGTIAIQGSFLLVLGLGGARVSTGAITVGDLIAFVLYLFLLVMPLGQALQSWTTLQTGLGALGRIEEVLRLPTEPDAGRAAAGASAMLELEHVSFSYDDGTAVLADVSFTLPVGTRTALVGPSGAGKSTVLALVERFYDVSSGAVRLGGVDVRDLPRTVLRAQLGYVEQEAPAMAGSLRENLLLAAPWADERQLQQVVDAVNLRQLVDRAPAGLDSEVGDGGVLLSGGERQRLAIGRALLASPPLLLLDEPTSNLDARNEALLRAAIDAVAVDRTLLVVAHRLSTVVDADQIVVLDAGRVVAVGRHDELVDSSPLYRELASQQLLVT
ncbi:MAG TPA: ABC transporter ATP-binding protein [Frankiaceae bacterium]|nr:ABC transporter ATP-binding protein [Frankiaceae bacterium]